MVKLLTRSWPTASLTGQYVGNPDTGHEKLLKVANNVMVLSGITCQSVLWEITAAGETRRLKFLF